MKVQILVSMGGKDDEGIFAYQKGEIVEVSPGRYKSIKGINCKVLTKVEKRPSKVKPEKR